MASTTVKPSADTRPNAGTIRVDLTRRMVDDVTGGDIGWVGPVEEIVRLTVLSHTLDESVLQVETELQLTDTQNNHRACATRLTYLRKNSAWSLDRDLPRLSHSLSFTSHSRKATRASPRPPLVHVC